LSLITGHEEDHLTSIRHIRRLTQPTRTANLGSHNGGGGAADSSAGGRGSRIPVVSGNTGASRANRRGAMMQLIELPSLPAAAGAGLTSSGRDPMDPIAGQCFVQISWPLSVV